MANIKNSDMWLEYTMILFFPNSRKFFAVTYGTCRYVRDIDFEPLYRALKTPTYLVFWAPDNYQQALLVSIGIYFQFLFVLPEIDKNCPLRAGQNNDTTWYLVFNMVLKNE